MKQILLKKGVANVVELPKPQIGPGEILVQLQVSCLSIGTELSGLRGSAIPLWKKVISQPEKSMKVIKIVGEIGVRRALSLVKEKNEMEYPTGYSAAGIIVSLSPDICDLAIGDRVACAGAQYANHAEYIRVSRNLCVRIPDNLDIESASTVTLGAIALQGVRRSQPTLGEIFVVVGLGILGQLTVQILIANGCRVIGIDTDINRIEKAKTMGMKIGICLSDFDEESIARLTDGHGADGVIITAASSSDVVVSNAFNMCRKKGRVILVGDVGLNLNRADFYSKEIDFLISTSYGPGRYDQNYEVHGLDYPISYVRWTENRNMLEYIRLLSEGHIKILPLVNVRFPFTEAGAAYTLISGEKKPLIALLTYSNAREDFDCNNNQMELKSNVQISDGKICLALIGVGSFVKSAHLPNLLKLSNHFHIRSIVNRTGPSARSVGKQFGADYISTNPEDIFSDINVNAVMIATRHNLHGSLALTALKAGKHVFVEKPTTIFLDELNQIKDFYGLTHNDSDGSSMPILMTGYNRRFSPHIKRVKELVLRSTSPFIVNYRMNAGYIHPDHWVHGDEGGGRNLGEACHIYDLFIFLANSKVKSFSAHSINPSTAYYKRNDNFITTISFEDGSVANLIYTSAGHKNVAKEFMELYVDGKTAILDNYKSLTVHGDSKLSFNSRIPNKGLLNELIEFRNGCLSGEWPIPLWQQLEVSELAFSIEEMLFDRK